MAVSPLPPAMPLFALKNLSWPLPALLPTAIVENCIDEPARYTQFMPHAAWWKALCDTLPDLHVWGVCDHATAGHCMHKTHMPMTTVCMTPVHASPHTAAATSRTATLA